jgi:hypothetical protein
MFVVIITAGSHLSLLSLLADDRRQAIERGFASYLREHHLTCEEVASLGDFYAVDAYEVTFAYEPSASQRIQ